MKYALSALAGSLVSTIAVVIAGHTPAVLVGLGFVTACALYSWVLKLVGLERLTRWVYYAESIARGKDGPYSVGELGRSFSGDRQRQGSNRAAHVDAIYSTGKAGAGCDRLSKKRPDSPERRAATYNQKTV